MVDREGTLRPRDKRPLLIRAEITKAPEPAADEGKVVDLMEALRRSVAEAKKHRPAVNEALIQRAHETAVAAHIQARETFGAAQIAVQEYIEGTFQKELQTYESQITVAEQNLRSAQDLLEPRMGATGRNAGDAPANAVDLPGHPAIRREILDHLREGPMTTGDLAERFPRLSRFAVMQHLGVLEEADLVVPRRDGRLRLNYLNPVPIQRIYQRWVSRYQEPWAESLVALKGAMESAASDRSRRRKRAG